jgi:AcrR family transcriptional regulator
METQHQAETQAKAPNKRMQSKQRTREKILTAAKALFDAEGYEAATIRAIAQAVGMSTGAVFAHWNDKAELYREIHGHNPISPEQGRQLLVAALRARKALEEDAEIGELAYVLELLNWACDEITRGRS